MKLSVLLAATLLLPLSAGATTIRGDYVESRTADVWTGPCFANGEVNLAGHEAILAWRVREGTWAGVALEGLSIVAVLSARATLGDPHAEPLPVRSILLVDELATAEQQAALLSMARELGGELLANVERVEAMPIRIALGAHGHVTLAAGGVAELRTRCLGEGDRHCRNEEVYYPPLLEVQNAQAAYTLAHAYRGEGLGATWSSPDRRSTFIAEFQR
jgi:hypothetical protein